MTNHNPSTGNAIQRLSQLWHVKSRGPATRVGLRFLAITAASIFVAEAIIMVFLDAIGPLGLWPTVLLDASLILLCTLPALYLWLYRPLIRHIIERNEAQEDVRESESKLSFHLQNTPVAVIEWNLDFGVVEWNEAAENIFGYTKEEALGRHAVGLLIPGSAREHVSQVWDDLLRNKGGFHSTNENCTKDSRTIVCDWSNTPLIDESGKVYGVASLVQDVTDRTKSAEALRESEERFRKAIVDAPLPIMIHAEDGEVVQISRVWTDITGYAHRDIPTIEDWTLKAYGLAMDSVRSVIDAVFERDAIAHDGEFEIKTASGTTRFWDFSSGPCGKLPDGRRLVISMAVDITERKKTVEELKSIFALSPDMIAVCTIEGKFLKVNPSWERVLGYTDKELLDLGWASLVHPDDYERTNAEVERQFKGSSVACFVNRYKCKDGSYKTLEWQASFAVDGIVHATARDITERKQTEDRVRLLLDNLPCVALILKKGSREIVASNNAAKSIGAIPGTTCYKTCAGRSESCTFCEAPEVWKTGERREIEVEYEGVWYHGIWVPLDDEHYVHYIFDITERKRAEEQLRVNEKKSRAWLENSPVCTKVMDADFNLQFMSRTGVEGLGVDDVSTLYGKQYPFDFYPDSFKDPMNMNLRRAKETGEIIEQEAHVVDVTGRKLWYHSTIVPVNDDNGRFDYMMVLSMETTERKEAEEALAEEIKLSEAIINSLPGMFYMYADDGTFIRWNKNHEILSGYSGEEMAKMTALDWFKEEDQNNVSATIKTVFETGEGHIQVTPVFKTGVAGPHDFTARRLDMGGRSYLIGVAFDISEIVRLQELESRAQRLETAGTIAGQVAHDFNNLLAPLMAYPDFIREDLPRNHPALAYLDDIERSAEQIAEINQQLLSLGRRGHYNQEVLNLNAIIHHSVKELVIPSEKVTVATDLDPDLMNIFGGGSQIHRVVTNLLCNAVDALQDIGHVVVKTENYYADDASGVYGRVPKGEYVKLTITDNGHGIADDIIQKILDPFFTTKTSDIRRGSGLGLSVVDAVVKDHGGYLDLETVVGKGTSLYVYFPTTRGALDDETSVDDTGGNETVLVIDDDEMQRNVTTNLLKKLGYQANAVDSGEQAIEYLKENPQDILVLDMVMPPGIDGTETYRQILEFNPNQKAIIVSGFSETARVQEVLALGAGNFVKKPLTKHALARAVRVELDRQTQPNPVH